MLPTALARRDDDRPSFRHLSRPPRRYNDQGQVVEYPFPSQEGKDTYRYPLIYTLYNIRIINTYRHEYIQIYPIPALRHASPVADLASARHEGGAFDPVFPYLLTIQQPAEGATLDVMIKNASGTFTVVSSGQTVYNGTKVDLFFAPQEGYRLTEGSITYNGNATTAETLAPNDKGYTAQRSFTMPAQPTTVTAEAELIRYTITYDPAGGTLPQGSPTQYTVVSDDLTLPKPTHTNTYPLLRGLERRRREYGSDRGERLHRRSLPHRPMERERAGRGGRRAGRDPDHHHHHDRR